MILITKTAHMSQMFYEHTTPKKEDHTRNGCHPTLRNLLPYLHSNHNSANMAIRTAAMEPYHTVGRVRAEEEV